MPRRDYSPGDRQGDYYSRRPRTEREYEELDVDISRSRYDGGGGPRRSETIIKERDTDTVATQGHRTERGGGGGGGRRLDFLRDDHGRSSHPGTLVVRDERTTVEDDVYDRGGRGAREERRTVIDDETYRRGPARRRSGESVRPRGPPTRGEETEEIVFRERTSGRGHRAPYPPSETGFEEREEVVFKEKRSRPPPPTVHTEDEERINVRVSERETQRPPRSTVEQLDVVEDVRVRRGGARGPSPARSKVEERVTFREDVEKRSRAPPTRTEVEEKVTIREEVDRQSRGPPGRSEVVEKDEVVIRERRSSPPRERRGRDVSEKIDVTIRERSAQPPRHRSQSRGALVARKEEQWVVRRPHSPSPSPPPPPRDYEKEEIIIRRKTRSPSPVPEPPREPTPEPPMPPPMEPIYRPPIIQEVITHHRYIDHPPERLPSPGPPPRPASPDPPPREDNLEIEIKRSGTRNGKHFDEDIIFEQDLTERKGREVSTRRRSVSASSRHSSPSPGPPARRRYEDDIIAEADFYNRRVAERAYAGEAYNGATRDWGLVDIPPGTERVRMDGLGGGRQEIYWDRYAGERRGRFVTGDRAYEEEFGPPMLPAAPPAPLPPLQPPPRDTEVVRETKIERRVVEEDSSRARTSDRMWTEISKDLIFKEAIEEMGYKWKESGDYFYVMKYLQYDDVRKLVELTDDIRRERSERLREIQWERQELEGRPKGLPPLPPMPPLPRGGNGRYDERMFTSEYRYDREPRRRR